ncbi:MAG: hypothetical protein Q9209_003406 [Squamulea sp. 1 TL-2023]
MAATSLRLRTFAAGLILLFSVLFLYLQSFHLRDGTDISDQSDRQPLVDIGTVNKYTSKLSKVTVPPYSHPDQAFGIFAPLSSGLHVKRDQEFLSRFGCLVDKGIKYFEQGIVKGTGAFGNPAPNFGYDPFGDNGWTLDDDNDDEIPEVWDDVFEHLPPREPRQDDYSFVKLDQDREFASAEGPSNKPTGAEYHGYYMPFHGSILIKAAFSPTYHMRRDGIPAAEIKKFIPRLNQLSDVAWEVWKAIADQPKTLRFFGRDEVSNSVTSPLLDYLFTRDRRSLEVPWSHRLTYGLDSDEGKALLATPNGIAVAWLLIHHHETLGRRDPRVSIFQVGRRRCIIWEMIPEGEKSTFDDYTAGFVSQGTGSFGHRDQKNDFSVPSNWGLIRRHVTSKIPCLVRRGLRFLSDGALPIVRRVVG